MLTTEQKRLAANAASKKYRSRPEIHFEVNKKAREYKTTLRQTEEGREKLNQASRKHRSITENRVKLNENSRLYYLKVRSTVIGAHKARISNTQSAYKLTEKAFQAKMNHQKGCCAICGRDFGSLLKRASVDHSHTTGLIRDLLCNNCNFCVGQIENFNADDVIKYLEQPSTSTLYNPQTVSQFVKSNNCEICGSKNRLVVDHDYTTGCIRGTLCHACNIALSAVESPMFPKYVEYLEKHNEI